MGWEKHEPAPSPFGLVAGNPTEYVVHTLKVEGDDDETVRTAVTEAVAQMCRVAGDNLEGTDFVLFEWDVLYGTLTVVFTTRGRTRDARDVLKVLAEGWDSRRLAHLPEEEVERIDAARARRVRNWIREALKLPAAQDTLGFLAKHGIAPAFTSSHHATTFEAL